MSGEVTSQSRRSSFSGRIQRAFSHERPASARSSDPNYIGPRRPSFSEHVQRVFRDIKPSSARPSFDQEHPGPDLNPGPGPRRPSFSEGVQRVFHHGLSGQNRIRRDRNSATLRKRYSDGASIPSRSPDVSSPAPIESEMAGIKPNTMRHRTHSILRPSVDYGPVASASTAAHSPCNEDRHICQDPLQASLRTGPGSSKEETGSGSEIRVSRSENGYANKKEKRTTQRLERDRKEFEKRLKKLEKAERKEFEQHMKELRAAEMKEFEASVKREEQEGKTGQFLNIHRPDGTNCTAATGPKRTPRRLTKKQPLTATNRPSSGDTNTSLSAFSSLFSSRPSSRSNSKTRRERSSERTSIDGSVSETDSYRPLSLNLQEPFGTAISTELAIRKNALLPIRTTPTQNRFPKSAATQHIKDNHATGPHDRMTSYDKAPNIGRKKSFGPSLQQERMSYSKPPRPQAFGQAISTELAMRKSGLLDMAPPTPSTASTTPKSMPCLAPPGPVPNAMGHGGNETDEEYLTAEEEV